ncbi:MAG: Gfo/Idh/MocA family oxidoreductase [Lachnospiraceae bacterium]|nr:Gfo/Idh/MocA family oxidoreductase [Lachnospiraceae bacterium]
MLRLGIIGTGRIAGRFVSECREVSEIVISAVYNPSQESAERFSEACGIPVHTDNPEEFKEAVDAVYIASPHGTHYEYAREMLESGKHVLCEKPMAMSSSEAEELFALSEKKGVLLMEAEKTAYAPGFLAMEEIIKSGRIGTVRDVEAAFTRLTPTDVREYLDLSFGGSFTEFASYPLLPVFRFLGTDYREAVFRSLNAPNGVDSYTKAYLEYENAFATVKTGLGVKSEGQLLISGTKGYLLAPSPWWLPKKFEVRYEDPNRIETYEYPFEGFGLRYEIRAFADAVLKGKTAGSGEKAEAVARAGILERFLSGQNRGDAPTEAEKKEVVIWAHRGCSFRYPENTIPAFLRAAELPGITGVELDVQRTKDGALVVIHDETVDRTREGNGYVKDFTLSELQALKVKRTDGGETEPYYIPTLQEVFDALKPFCDKNGLKINIELKTSVVRYEGIEREVLELVRKNSLREHIVYSSFLADSIRIVKELEPKARTGMLAVTLEDCAAAGKRAGADDLHPCVAGLQGVFGKEKSGRKIRAWNASEPLFGSGRELPKRDLREYTAFGVTDIFTNVPERYIDQGGLK